jgi:hypothetical protein
MNGKQSEKEKTRETGIQGGLYALESTYMRGALHIVRHW